MDFDLFISHKTEDDALATQLADGLTHAGVRCFVDHVSADFTQWVDLVAFADQASALLLLLTPNSYDDQGVNLLNESLPMPGSDRVTIVVHTPDVAVGQGRVGRQFRAYSWITWDPDQDVESVVESVRRRLKGLASARPEVQSAGEEAPDEKSQPLVWYFDDDAVSTEAFVGRHGGHFRVRTFTEIVDVLTELQRARLDSTRRPDAILLDLYCPRPGVSPEDRAEADRNLAEFVRAEEELKGFVDAAWRPFGVDIVQTVREVYPEDRLPVVMHTQEGLFLLKDELVQELKDLGAGWLLKGRFSPETDRMVIERLIMKSGHQLGPGKPKVLIIDDNRKYIDAFIERQGDHYDIEAIETEAEVLSTLRRRDAEGSFPDVFVVDMYYPWGSDADALARIDLANQKLREFAEIEAKLRRSIQQSFEPLGPSALKHVRKVFSADEVPVLVYAQSGMLLLSDAHIQDIERLGGTWLLKDRYDARTEQTMILGEMLRGRRGGA